MQYSVVLPVTMRYIIILLAFLLPPLAVDALEITGMEVDRTEDGEHVSLHMSARTEYEIFIAEDNSPTRLVIDLQPASWRGKVWSPGKYHGALIRGVRFGRHDKNTSRIVMDLADGTDFSNAGLVRERGYYSLEFDLIGRPVSKHFSRHKSAAYEKQAKSENRSSRPVIVIDAGHGGQDDGTSGVDGSYEKDLTLNYAEALREALNKTGRYHAVLTRSDDTYLLLGERVRRARAAHGNLFISIHADSSPIMSARGLSVYTISEKASDKQSAALAEKENKADIIGGMDLSDTSKDVADILIDLTQRETRAKSNKFATILVKELSHEVHLLNHTHRQAGFAVLKAPDIPSVLIETGFLSNPREEGQLQSATHRKKFLHGVIKAVDVYFSG